jgi:hypothetical protein
MRIELTKTIARRSCATLCATFVPPLCQGLAYSRKRVPGVPLKKVPYARGRK